MNKVQKNKLAMAIGVALLANPVFANQCPSLGNYRVMSFSAHDLPLKIVAEKLLEDTAWKLVADGGDGPNVSLRNVSGAVDGIINRTVSTAASQSDWGVIAKVDAGVCAIKLSLTPPRQASEQIAVASPAPLSAAPATAAAPAAATGSVSEATKNFDQLLSGSAVSPQPSLTPVVRLTSGKMLSAALADALESRGWQLRWNIEDDYLIDVDIPVPSKSVQGMIEYVFTTYQSQGGLMGSMPRFASANRVVVVEPMKVR